MRISEIFESVRLAARALRDNKMRSFLASLGVLIGISTVILMGWLLTGLNDIVSDTFNMIGADVMFIDKYAWAGGDNWDDIRNRKDITKDQVDDFMTYPSSAEAVAPDLTVWGGTVIYKGETYMLPIVGTTAEYSKFPLGTVEDGRFFNQIEERYGTNVIVMGNKAYYTVFPDSNGIGKEIKIKGRKFTVIGFSKKQGTLLFDQMDNQCFIPLRNAIALYGKGNSYSIAVKAGGEERLDEVRSEITGIMRTVRNIEPGEKKDFSINETKAFEDSIAEIKKVVGIAGIGITMLSFLVGVIGIMNIMFVSVTERTKEIGIRKAVGAKKASIMVQFIAESSALCFIGALFSYIFCSGLVFAASLYLPKVNDKLGFVKPYISVELLAIAALVSIFVGIVAGLIPAYRASRLDPVDSLRYE
jgi:putative ABC transport system permease protein